MAVFGIISKLNLSTLVDPQLFQVNEDMVVNHGITVVGEYKQHISGHGLVASVLESLMEHVEIPKGFAIQYTDTFGYDGCLAAVVLKANARDPGTARSCVTICHEQDSQSYITNMIGNAVFNMAKSKELDVADFQDLQVLVDKLREPVSDPRVSVKLEATVYLPAQRVLAVLERHVSRWTPDLLKGEEPRT